jgi:tRNA (mo5U34)-methyltransferase
MLFQSMQRGSKDAMYVEQDYDFWREEMFGRPDFPTMYFIEHKYAGDPTNWWIPNRACVEAMLRSSGFQIIAHPEVEVFLCRVREQEDETDLTRATRQAKESLRA